MKLRTSVSDVLDKDKLVWAASSMGLWILLGVRRHFAVTHDPCYRS